MQLTESQISTRQAVFYELVEFITNEEYELDEEYITTEEDIAITNEVMEYFVQGFKEPTLVESIKSIISGKDINEELYLEIFDIILLDESIGSAIAGAVHGVGSWNAKRKATNATNAGKAADIVHNAAVSKSSTHAAGAATGGVFHKLKQTYLNTKVNNAKSKLDTAALKSVRADREAKAKQEKRSELATKIDTHISNAGHKVAHIAAGGALGAKPDTHTPEAPKTIKKPSETVHHPMPAAITPNKDRAERTATATAETEKQNKRNASNEKRRATTAAKKVTAAAVQTKKTLSNEKRRATAATKRESTKAAVEPKVTPAVETPSKKDTTTKTVARLKASNKSPVVRKDKEKTVDTEKVSAVQKLADEFKKESAAKSEASKVTPVVKPVVKAEPVAKPVVKDKPVDKPVVKDKPVSEPVAKPVDKPVVKDKPVVAPVVKTLLATRGRRDGKTFDTAEKSKSSSLPSSPFARDFTKEIGKDKKK